MTDLNNLTIDNETGEILNNESNESDTGMNSTNQIPAPAELQDQVNAAINEVPSKAKVRFVEELIYLFTEEDALKASIKELKAQIKEHNHDAAILTTIAKAIMSEKENELNKKSKDTLEALEEVQEYLANKS